ncbi:unnamed protein product [Brassica rapa subsp. trilocularis]
MTACGVCHSDLHVMMKGEIPFSSPWVIGHEITGEVVEHGPVHSLITRSFPVGSRVVGAFIMPSGTCSYCAKDDKLQKAMTLGATHIVNAAKEDAVERIRVGWVWMLLLKHWESCDDWGLLQAGSVGEIDINRLVRRKIKVIKSYGGRARQDLPKVVKLAESGIFNLANTVSSRYKFEDAGKSISRSQ